MTEFLEYKNKCIDDDVDDDMRIYIEIFCIIFFFFVFDIITLMENGNEMQ